MERGLLRDQLRGSRRFNEPKHDLNIIKKCIEDVNDQASDYKLKHTKPKVEYYGSYTEMLHLLLIRHGSNKKPARIREDLNKTFKTNPADFSHVETG